MSLRPARLLPSQIHSNHSKRRKDLAHSKPDTDSSNFDEIGGIVNLLLRIGLAITCVVLIVTALLKVLAGLLTSTACAPDDRRDHELT